jgi:5-deoxy-D-glucuronate isomerase
MGPEGKQNMDRMIFRGTNAHLGRHIAVRPDNSTMRHLSYGRIILRSNKRTETFSTGDHETGLICLSGETTVVVDGQVNSLSRYDSIYIPRDSTVEVTTDSSVDLADGNHAVGDRNRAPSPWSGRSRECVLRWTCLSRGGSGPGRGLRECERGEYGGK